MQKTVWEEAKLFGRMYTTDGGPMKAGSPGSTWCSG